MTDLTSDYVHVNLIGEGAFSVVQKYKRIADGEHVAIKFLKKVHTGNRDYRTRFLREIELLRELAACSEIVPLLDAVSDIMQPYYIMPYADANLQDFISRNNDQLQLEQRLSLFDQIICGIAYAHEHDVLHRDICPANVLIFNASQRPTVKLADFGLGRIEDETSHFTRSSVAGYGHVFYVAPEQREKLKDADERSDIYSLGKVLNFVLTGKNPVAYHDCEFGPVIQRATQFDPDNRYSNIAEMREEYEALKSLHLTPPTVNVTLVKHYEHDTTSGWFGFHALAIEGRHVDHPWHDYVDPVITFLRSEEHLNEYYSAVGSDVEAFVDTFLHRVSNLGVGWPFDDAPRFGEFLESVYRLVRENPVKLKCLMKIWDLAFVSDRWKVQPIAIGLLEGVPAGIVSDLALHISQGSCTGSADRFAGLKLPAVLRNAINQVTGG